MFGLAGNFDEYCCKTCGLVRLSPQPTQKELVKYYPSKNYYSYAKKSKQSFFGMLRSYLVTHLNKPTVLSSIIGVFLKVPAMPQHMASGKILDVGCGSGDTLALLQSVGWKTYGLDVDQAAIRAAHERGLQNVSFGSYTDMTKYPDNFFDVIRLYHVIEHLDNPGRCLSLIYKKLKNGGELIIGTPNGVSLVARVAKQYWYNLDAPRHLYLFSPKTLGILARNADFSDIHITFASAGGWVGSLQYKLEDVLSKDIDLINRPWLVMLFYPFEWLLDKFGLGDVFVLTARK